MCREQLFVGKISRNGGTVLVGCEEDNYVRKRYEGVVGMIRPASYHISRIARFR